MGEEAKLPAPASVPASAPPRRAEPRTGVGGVVAAGLASASLFACSLLHPLAVPLVIASPFPLTLQRLRSGLGSGLLATLLALALVGGLLNAGQAVAFLLLLAVPGLLIAEAMARGRGLRRGGLWAFALLSVLTSLALVFANQQLARWAVEPFEQARSDSFLGQLKDSGWTAEMITQWTEQAQITHDVLAVVYPAAYIILGGLFVLANTALLRWYLARRDPGWLDGGEFEGLRLPLALAVVFVLAGASVALPPLRPAAYNVLLVLAFFFGLQGLAVVAFYARRLAAPPFLRAAVVLLVLVNPWAPQILALMGLFDIWLDLRKYAEPRPSAGPGSGGPQF
jgi:uncharacterized protein YybS (DUF2232 family)